jgi:DNA topoisomerase-1
VLLSALTSLQAQLAVTTYLVDKLALRAGGEKDEDLADTVGVCTLRVMRRAAVLSAPPLTVPVLQVGHVQRIPPHTLKFDFLVRMRRTYAVRSVCV